MGRVVAAAVYRSGRRREHGGGFRPSAGWLLFSPTPRRPPRVRTGETTILSNFRTMRSARGVTGKRRNRTRTSVETATRERRSRVDVSKTFEPPTPLSPSPDFPVFGVTRCRSIWAKVLEEFGKQNRLIDKKRLQTL